MSLWIQETFINETKGYQFGSGPWIDSECDTMGELFRQLSREYGRCTSKIYRDVKSGDSWKVETVGWVFEKRMEYEDAYRISNKKERVYLRHVWVSVSTVDPHQPLKPVSPWEPTS